MLMESADFQQLLTSNRNKNIIFQIMQDSNVIANFKFYLDNDNYFLILQAQLSQPNQSKEFVDLFKSYA